jgi:hypothetical protein
VQYCQYLNDVVTTTKVDVRTNTEVLDIVGAVPQVPLPRPKPKPPTEGAGPAVSHSPAQVDATATTGDNIAHGHGHIHGPDCGHKHAPHGEATAGQAPVASPEEDEREVDLDTIPTIIVETSKGLFGCKFLVWAGGEFQWVTRLLF